MRFGGFRRAVITGIVAVATGGYGATVGAQSTFFCAWVEFSDPGETAREVSSSRFSAANVADLSIAVTLDAELGGEHLLELELYTPNGHLYQVLTAPFTTEAVRAGESVRIEGYPFPLPLQQVSVSRVEGRSRPTVLVTFPIGGTLIASNSLYGVWEVKPRLDGQLMACELIIVLTIDP